MKFKPGQQCVVRENKPWLLKKFGDKVTFGPRIDEILTVTESFRDGGYNLIGLAEYPCNSAGPCYWDADCFEPLITDLQLKEALETIEQLT